jgi:AraC family transcriptional regulator
LEVPKLPANPKLSAPPKAAPQTILNPRGNVLGQFNAILSGSNNRYYVPDFAGPLSIKTMISGSATWETPGRRYVVHENTYLVLNDRQHYRMTIDSVEKPTTFCIFFERGYVEEVQRAVSLADVALLDEPAAKDPDHIEFRERLEAQPSSVLKATKAFHKGISNGLVSNTGAEEAFLSIAVALVKEHAESRGIVTRLEGRRPATREELYKRVLRGRDFLLSSLSERTSLAAAARAACLSPYHFLRVFSEAFGQTPHQYFTQQRLARAWLLLARGNHSVTEVCLESGFQSLGSFSSLFRKHFGVSPSQVQGGATRS